MVEKDDLVLFKKLNLISGHYEKYIGRVMKLKDNRKKNIYLDRVIKINRINDSLAAIFSRNDNLLHDQIDNSNIIKNFGKIDLPALGNDIQDNRIEQKKKVFKETFPEYLI